MDSQYQESSAQKLVARDDPKYNIDPAFILFWMESPFLSIVTAVFYCCFLASNRASTLGHRNLPVLLNGGMVASNLALIILLGRQWYSYHRAFLALDEEMPNQIYMPVHISLYLSILCSCIILSVAALIIVGLWRPRIILRKSRLDEEARHSDAGTDYNPELYNQPFLSWINQVSLTCAWVITCVSMQAKLPGAAYANMPDAHLFPPSRLELSLQALASAHFYLGIVGWLILTFVMFQFGKTLVLFRLDATTRCKRFWRMFKALYEAELAKQRALRASREGTARETTSWPSSYSSSPLNTPASSSLDMIAVETDGNAHIEMEETWSTTMLNESREEWRRPVVNLPSWDTEDNSLGIPQSARLRN